MLSRSSLLFAASSLLTACLSESDTEGSNYFVDSFQEVANLPYPVDVCVATSLTTWAIYSCSDDGLTVTKTSYGSDPTCTTAEEGVDAVEYTSDNATALGVYSFNCDGMNNYASVILCVSAQQDTETGLFDCSNCAGGAAPAIESLQATDVCFNGGDAADYANVLVDCDADAVDAFYYDPTVNPTCDMNVTAAGITNSAGAECTLFTDIEASVGEVPLYWTYAGCSGYNSSDTSDTSDSMPSTSSSDADGDSNNEDVAGRLSMTHSVFALVMVAPLIKLFV